MYHFKILFFLLVLPFLALGQNDDSEHIDVPDLAQNVLKIDIAPIFYKKGIGLIYERTIFSNFTIGAKTELLFNDYKLSGLFRAYDLYSLPKGKGYGFHIQLKHFFTDDAPDGFFYSGRLGYRKYTAEPNDVIEIWNGSMGFGYQLLIKDIVSLTIGIDYGLFLANPLYSDRDFGGNRVIDLLLGVGYAF